MTTTAHDELEALVAARAEAVAARHREGLLAQVDADVLAFPVLPPANAWGRGATDDALETWFAGYSDGPHYEPHVLRVEADGDLGVVAFFYHVTGTLASGDAMDMWVRATLVCRRDETGWRVVHSHESVPFRVSDGQALISESPVPA